jgi:hypothetical protein
MQQEWGRIGTYIGHWWESLSRMFNGPTMKKCVMHLLRQALLIICEFKNVILF